MTREIPLFRPVIAAAAERDVADVLRSGWLGTGPRTDAFERALCDRFRADQVVGTSSGTSALVIALRLAEVAGREVIVPALTYVATVHAIVRAGGIPVFADVQAQTGNLDPDDVRRRMTDRCAAVLVVHYGGLPADLDELRQVASEHGARVIEDCAHAAGATYHGAPIGSGGDLHAFSFHATKNLTAGGGGALVTRHADETSRARRLRSLGIDTDWAARQRTERTWDYDVVEHADSCAMNDIQAAIGLAQLPLLDIENARRATIAAHYRERLGKLDAIELLDEPPDRSSSNHLFVIRTDGRDDLMAALDAQGIHAGVHYRRVDSFTTYELADLPATEGFWRRCISLPMHLQLDDDDVDRVCDAIEAWAA